MTRDNHFSMILLVAGFALTYFFSIRLGLALSIAPENISVFWSANALAIAWIYLSPSSLRTIYYLTIIPIYLLSVFTYGGYPLDLLFGLSLCNLAEVFLVIWFLNRFLGSSIELCSFKEIWILLGTLMAVCWVVGLVAAAVVWSSVGANYWRTWINWAMGDATPMLVILPVAFAWKPSFSNLGFGLVLRRRYLEATVLAAFLLCVCALSFNEGLLSAYEQVLLQNLLLKLAPYLLIISVLMISVRFSTQGASLACLTVGIVAIGATYQGHGPFADESFSLFVNLITFQVFLTVLVIAALLLAVAVERYLRSIIGLRDIQKELEQSYSDLENLVEDRTVELQMEVQEREQREQSLRDANQRFQSIIDNTSAGIIICDRDAQIIQANSAMVDILGFSYEELLGMPLTEITDPDDVSSMEEHFSQLKEGSLPSYSVDKRYRHRDGSLGWLSISVNTIKEIGEQRRVQFVGVITDITGRKEAEQQQKKSESRLRTAIEALDDGFVIYDTEDRLVLCNETYREMYAQSAELLSPGTKFEDILREGLRQDQYSDAMGREEEWLKERLDHHRSAETTVEQQLNDGRWLRIAERQTPEGEVVGFRVDITELKKAMEEAEEASNSKSRFLSQMSHELRSPLNAIIGFSEVLNNEIYGPLNNEHYKKYVHSIHGAGIHLLNLIGDILDISKIEAGRLELESTNFELRALCEEVRSLINGRAREKNIEFVIESAIDVPQWLVGDPTRLRQVLVNLADNAVKFTHKGVISVLIKKLNGKSDMPLLKFSVTDTGIGIPDDKLEQLFEAFTQAESVTTRKYGGTGLGLNICKQLVQAMGGEMQVESKVEEGSCFWFCLPLTEGLAPTVEAVKGLPKTCAPLSILIAEDVDMNVMLVKAMLKPEGHRLSVAQDGVEALEAVQNEQFDVILMDAHMPRMGGIEATKRIRALADPEKASIPIIALSADVMKEQKELFLSAGMNDCVPKPYQRDELRRALAAVGRGKTALSIASEATDEASPLDEKL